MPTKKILPGSAIPTWRYKQEALFEKGERRRTAVEAVWDLILYYAKTGKRLLPVLCCDWTETLDKEKRRVYVGCFNSNGILIGSKDPPPIGLSIGVCPVK